MLDAVEALGAVVAGVGEDGVAAGVVLNVRSHVVHLRGGCMV